MEKNELFQIGEVSKLFHISVSILRHYDKIGLLRPEVTDPKSGYRYYSVRQFECLNTIRYLRALDMPLEKISVFLNNRDVEHIRRLLLEQKNSVESRLQELANIQKKIENRLAQINDALHSVLYTVQIEEKPARRLAFLRKKLLPKNYLDLEHSIRELEQKQEQSVTFLGKVGLGITKESLMQRQFQPYEMVFIVLDEEDTFQGETLYLPQETCAVIRFQGSHSQAARYYKQLMDYLEETGNTVCGFSKEITMIDDGLTNDTSKFVTEIQIPVYKQ